MAARHPTRSPLIALFATLLTTMVLVAQTRQQHDAERRAHLELHVNLLAEEERPTVT